MKITLWCFFQIPNNSFNAYWHTCVHTPRRVTKFHLKKSTNQQNKTNQPIKQKIKKQKLEQKKPTKTPTKQKTHLVCNGWVFKRGQGKHQYLLPLFEMKTSSSKTLKLSITTLFLIKNLYCIKGCSKFFRIPVSWK